MNVYIACLKERAILEDGVNALEGLMLEAGRRGYHRIDVPYTRTDLARNLISVLFLEDARDDDDALVMLDCDHKHPPDLIERLLSHNVDVVGALAFKRDHPFSPCFFVQEGDSVVFPKTWSYGLVPCYTVGTGAIAIRKRVFRKLEEKGCYWPYFRYSYFNPVIKQGNEWSWQAIAAGKRASMPSEEIFFGMNCAESGIQHYVDTTLEIPHLSVGWVDSTTVEAYRADNPDLKFS